MTRKLMILYVPVIHRGYLNLINTALRDFSVNTEIGILGDYFVKEMQDRSEIRAISAQEAVVSLQAIFGKDYIYLLDDKRKLKQYKIIFDSFILTNDDVVRSFAQKYLKGQLVENRSTFLRWDSSSVFSQTDVNYDRVSSEPIDLENIALALNSAQNSGDWWRQVGAVLIDTETCKIIGRNRHMPTEITVYIDGDPRDVIEAGKLSEMSTALHAEQDIISQAARNGISLQGASLYLTVFPCPVCAKLIAATGIKYVYFASGHASLDGESVLRSAGVELIYVKTPS